MDDELAQSPGAESPGSKTPSGTSSPRQLAAVSHRGLQKIEKKKNETTKNAPFSQLRAVAQRTCRTATALCKPGSHNVAPTVTLNNPRCRQCHNPTVHCQRRTAPPDPRQTSYLCVSPRPRRGRAPTDPLPEGIQHVVRGCQALDPFIHNRHHLQPRKPKPQVVEDGAPPQP